MIFIREGNFNDTISELWFCIYIFAEIFRYIDNVLSLNYSKFSEHLESSLIFCSITIEYIDIGSNQGPVVQSVVSLTSPLRVISLTVLADSIINILIFFAEKM